MIGVEQFKQNSALKLKIQNKSISIASIYDNGKKRFEDCVTAHKSSILITSTCT